MRVACIQLKPEPKKPRENILCGVALLQRAVEQGADLVVFPELTFVGYSFMNVGEAAPFAEVVGKPTAPLQADKSLHVMPAMAKKLGVSIVWGFIEKDPVTGRLYNAQAFATPDGRLVSTRKKNRFGCDYMWASVGKDDPPVVQLAVNEKMYRVGMLICRDIRNKAGKSERLFFDAHEADLVVLSANWGKGAAPANAWIEFVEEAKCWLAVADRYGEEMPNDFGHGGTCVISPSLRVHCEGLRWDQDCIVMADIP